MPRFPSHLLFLCISLTLSLLPQRVQAALPKDFPTAPAKFLTGACRTGGTASWFGVENV